MKINIFNKQKKFEEEVLSGEYAVGDMEYSSYYKDSFKRLKKNKMSMFCLFVIVVVDSYCYFCTVALHHMIRTCTGLCIAILQATIQAAFTRYR